eukprot:5299961-Pleurochrysis_carterae.AAC.1
MHKDKRTVLVPRLTAKLPTQLVAVKGTRARVVACRRPNAHRRGASVERAGVEEYSVDELCASLRQPLSCS